MIEEKEITKNLKHKVSISGDESLIYLNVDYMDGKFTVERSYRNNTFALEEMAYDRDKLNTEYKVRKYLNLGEINE
jgi:hypothetical protein